MKSRVFRIRSQKEFDLVSNGSFHKEMPFWFRYTISDQSINDPIKLGFAVSKKYGNAVVRNKLKRQIREVFYRNNQLQKLPDGMIVLVGLTKNTKARVSYKEVDFCVSSFISHIS